MRQLQVNNKNQTNGQFLTQFSELSTMKWRLLWRSLWGAGDRSEVWHDQHQWISSGGCHSKGLLQRIQWQCKCKYCVMGSQMFLRQYFHPAVSLFLTLDCLWLFFAGEEFQLSQCQRSKRTCQDCQDCQDSAETSLIITLDTPSLISWHQHSVLSYQHFSPQHKQTANTCKGFASYYLINN